MSDDEEIAALVIDNGSGMCKGMLVGWFARFVLRRDVSVISGSSPKVAQCRPSTNSVETFLSHIILCADFLSQPVSPEMTPHALSFPL
jgi:hypothetical protein